MYTLVILHHFLQFDGSDMFYEVVSAGNYDNIFFLTCRDQRRKEKLTYLVGIYKYFSVFYSDTTRSSGKESRAVFKLLFVLDFHNMKPHFCPYL